VPRFPRESPLPASNRRPLPYHGSLADPCDLASAAKVPCRETETTAPQACAAVGTFWHPPSPTGYPACDCFLAQLIAKRRTENASRDRSRRNHERLVLSEHVFGHHRRMTSQGSPHARFRRALLTKNMTIIDAAAAELGRLGLEDALPMLVVMAEKGDPCFPEAAARFAARPSSAVSARRRPIAFLASRSAGIHSVTRWAR
jgi:hypothetical protein